MKDNQLKKLNRVVRKLAAEVASLRKLIRRELLATQGGSGRTGKKGKKRSKKKGKKGNPEGPEPAPPAA